jgi:hypothetical protein
MPEANTYHGSCQCGAVTFRARVDISSPVTCNCSRCQRMGFVLAFTPRENFELLSGADSLTEYLFNRHAIRHLFCRTCGVEGFALGATPEGAEIAAINVNCLDGVDPRTLPTTHCDGRSA